MNRPSNELIAENAHTGALQQLSCHILHVPEASKPHLILLARLQLLYYAKRPPDMSLLQNVVHQAKLRE